MLAGVLAGVACLLGRWDPVSLLPISIYRETFERAPPEMTRTLS
jgi:hypothetical protein